MLSNEKLKQNFTILKKGGLKNKKMLRFKLFIMIDRLAYAIPLKRDFEVILVYVIFFKCTVCHCNNSFCNKFKF